MITQLLLLAERNKQLYKLAENKLPTRYYPLFKAFVNYSNYLR